jgi:hypothetical protein
LDAAPDTHQLDLPPPPEMFVEIAPEDKARIDEIWQFADAHSEDFLAPSPIGSSAVDKARTQTWGRRVGQGHTGLVVGADPSGKTYTINGNWSNYVAYATWTAQGSVWVSGNSRSGLWFARW